MSEAHDITAARVDLAAAFRWAARLGLHEAVANHFSAAVSADGKQFLLNPRGRHFSRVRASELLLLDAEEAGSGGANPLADPTAWYLHAHIHQHVPRARVIFATSEFDATGVREFTDECTQQRRFSAAIEADNGGDFPAHHIAREVG